MIQTTNVIESILNIQNAEDAKYRINAQLVKQLSKTSLTGGANGHGQIKNGKVYKDDIILANFNKFTTLSISYITEDAEEQSGVLASVQEFLAEAKEYVDTVSIIAALEEEKQ